MGSIVIKIKPNEGNLLVWRERKIVSDSIFTPDDFDRSILEELPKEEAEKLREEWEKIAQQEMGKDREVAIN